MKVMDIVTGQAMIGNAATLGMVHLKVKNLEEQVRFYHKALKMTVITKADHYAILGDKNLTPLLYLKKKDNLKRYSNTSGLYHFALLYPNEKELAKAVAWLMAINYPNYPTDHGFSKTTYLKDFEGNEIELYIRTPDRSQYIIKNGQPKVLYNDGTMTDGRDALDLEELYRHITSDDVLDSPLENMQLGHVHLYGYNIEDMQAFYTNVIGYAGGQYLPYFKMSDVSLSKEEYHVIAFNSWKNTTTKAPEDALGLDYYTIKINDKLAYEDLLARIKVANINIIKENNDIFIFDPSAIKIKLELDVR